MKIVNRIPQAAIYLVVDPSMHEPLLIARLSAAVGTGKIGMVQLWDHWQRVEDRPALVRTLKSVCHSAGVPLLVNNDWQLLADFDLDGIHLDEAPVESLANKRKEIGRAFLVGLTLGDSLTKLSQVDLDELDYLSFCAVFPSASAGTCEIVSPETIRAAAQLTDIPVFLSGGINLSTIPKLAGLSFHGLAIISGIMGSDNPAEAVGAIDHLLNSVKNDFF